MDICSTPNNKNNFKKETSSFVELTIKVITYYKDSIALYPSEIFPYKTNRIMSLSSPGYSVNQLS